jgi:adenylylsulfate kinase-like enzyme
MTDIRWVIAEQKFNEAVRLRDMALRDMNKIRIHSNDPEYNKSMSFLMNVLNRQEEVIRKFNAGHNFIEFFIDCRCSCCIARDIQNWG